MTEQENSVAQLPKGWILVGLGEIAAEINPGFPSGSWYRNNGQGVPHLRPMNIDVYGRVDLSDIKYVQKENHDALRKGDVLFNNTNSPKLLGKTTYIKHDTIWAYSNHMTRIRFFPDSLEPGFIGHYLHYLFRNGFFMMKCVHHVNQASINSKFLAENVCIPLPPVAEQSRVVSKIEQLFTLLDVGVESLLKVKTLLKRYRQAVLKCAFEGKLTEEWRRTHRHEIEPATKLLQQIKQERKRKLGPKYKELPPIDASELPELPQSWIWVRLEEVSDTTSGGTPSRKKKEYYGGSIPWLKSGELKDGVINVTEESITDEGLANSSTRIIPKGTLLMALYGATVGKLGVLGIDSAINQAICAIFPDGRISRDFLFWYLRKHRDELLNIRKGGAQPNISQDVVRNIVLQLPSLREQQNIVEEIENRMSLINDVETVLEKSLKQAERLRQGILKQAFEGKLVPQDPSDEPADKLLQRIREERAKSNGEKDVNKKNTSRQLELSSYVE